MPPYTTESAETGGRRQIVVTLLFVVLAVTLNYLPGDQQQAVASTLRATALRPFVVTQEGIAEARIQAAESRGLRTRLDSMVAVLTDQTHLVEENRRLRGLLSLAERLGPDYRPAAVIRPGTAGSESMFALDVGVETGVRPNAPVITRHGLVGTVRDVSARSSIGMDWTHPEFRASAMTLDGTTYGIVESYRGDFREEDRLVLNGTAFHTTLEDNTVIVSSGLGGVFPRGIPIGRVSGLAEADAGWRKSYWLDAFVDPGSITHVLVGTGETEIRAPLRREAAATDTSTGNAPAIDTTGVRDVSDAWPPDSIMTAEELALVSRRREDSLRALGDSVRLLREILAVQTFGDSVRRVLTSDSLRVPRPAPPTGGGNVGNTGNTGNVGNTGAGAGTGGAGTAGDTLPPDTAAPIPDLAPPDTTGSVRDTTPPDTIRAAPPSRDVRDSLSSAADNGGPAAPSVDGPGLTW